LRREGKSSQKRKHGGPGKEKERSKIGVNTAASKKIGVATSEKVCKKKGAKKKGTLPKKITSDPPRELEKGKKMSGAKGLN